MKTWIVLSCIVSLAVVGLMSCGRKGPSGPIKWASSFDEAFATAKRENKPAMIYIYTDGCPHCNQVEENVLTAAPVVELSAKFVCFKLNPEEESEHGKLFNFLGSPSLIFTDANKNDLLGPETGIFTEDGERLYGLCPRTPDDFVKKMNTALDAFTSKK